MGFGDGNAGAPSAAHISTPALQKGHLKRALPEEWMPKQRCSKGKSPLIHRIPTLTGIPRTVVGWFSVCVSSTRARSTWASSERESPLRIKIQSCGRRAAFFASSAASKIRLSHLPSSASAAQVPCTRPYARYPKQVARWHCGEAHMKLKVCAWKDRLQMGDPSAQTPICRCESIARARRLSRSSSLSTSLSRACRGRLKE